jgi:DNA modification methylase
MFYRSVKQWIDSGMPWNSFILGDCMEGMAAMPDKIADLACVDPPYGINTGTSVGGANRLVKMGGTNLSVPKFTGGSTTQSPRIKNTLRN